jgi:hypothetical protein
MMPNEECAPLWCTSVHSFLIGASHPQELITAAAEAGCYGIAITDRDSLGGVVEAWQQVTELSQEGAGEGGTSSGQERRADAPPSLPRIAYCCTPLEQRGTGTYLSSYPREDYGDPKVRVW